MKAFHFSLASRLVLAICASAMLGSPAVQAQQLNVLYSFQNAPDGAVPLAGVTFDSQGNLFGTTQRGGLLECPLSGCGTVFELSPNGGNWTEQLLTQFEFTGFYGGTPVAPVVLDRLGNVYGTYGCTFDCFSSHAGGGVFEVTRTSNGWTPLNLAGYWGNGFNTCGNGGCGLGFNASRLYASTGEYDYNGNNSAMLYLGRQSATSVYTTVLHLFTGTPDGSLPALWFTFDANGSIYGTTQTGGAENLGTVFMLQNVGGSLWLETQLYSFRGGSDGAAPAAGVIFDSSGNLYGTTISGGSATAGTVFKLTHNANGSWTESLLYTFQGGASAGYPTGPLVFDAAGNLWGTAEGGAFSHGAIFELTPNGNEWSESVPYSFTGGADGDGPSGQLVLDAGGNLYGTTQHGGAFPTCSDQNNCGGVVYQFVP